MKKLQQQPQHMNFEDQDHDTQVPYVFDDLKEWQFVAYGVGHFMNDLGGAIYFNYLFYFLKRIVKTTSAPLGFLAGQITDGLATPIVGYLSDKTASKYGQRKPWYVGGFIIFLIGYFPIYQNIKKLIPSISSQLQTAFYVSALCLVNIGWAAVQISHMSLVPSLTCSRKRRDRLNNTRNTFTFLSNVFILSLGTILFATMENPTLEINLLSYFGAGCGITAALFFTFGINEVQLSQASSRYAKSLKLLLDSQIINTQPKETQRALVNPVIEFRQEDLEEQEQSSIVDWFKKPSFYVYGVCYMSVRLYVNLFGTLLPFYLVDVLHMGSAEQKRNDQIPFQVALVALIIYLFQFITSMLMNRIYEKIGRKKALFIGTVLCFASSFAMIFLISQISYLMYGIAVFVGISQSLVLSTGINLISDVVGKKSQSGAFVFGIYSLVDKFSSGFAIYFITNSPHFEDSISFKKWMTIIMPSISCVLSCTVVLFTPIKEYANSKAVQLMIGTNKLNEELVYD